MVIEESFENFYRMSVHSCSGEQTCLDGYSRVMGCMSQVFTECQGIHGMSRVSKTQIISARVENREKLTKDICVKLKTSGKIKDISLRVYLI